MRLRKVLLEENRWWCFSSRQALAAVTKRIRRVYLVADAEGSVICAGESVDIRNAVREHAEGTSEQAACIRSHGAERSGSR